MRLGKQVEVVEGWKPFSREDMDFEGGDVLFDRKRILGCSKTVEDEH